MTWSRRILALGLISCLIPAGVFAAKPRVQRPEFIGGPLPVFNPERETKEGRITLAAHVDEKGYVQHVEVREITNPTLERPCTIALLSWRFAPAKLNGQAVPSVVLQRFNFDDEYQH